MIKYEFFDDDSYHYQNPNFRLSKSKIVDNIFDKITNKLNNENCIWFRNNGKVWHTVFSFESRYHDMMINGEKRIILLPELLIHIKKNNGYGIKIYFKNDLCSEDDLIESFLNVNEFDDMIIKKGDYVSESNQILNYIFNDYNFIYNDIEEYINETINDQYMYFDSLEIINNLKLSDMITDWKNEIDNYDINISICDMIMYDKNLRNGQAINDSKLNRFIFLDIIFEVSKNIKIGGKKYAVCDIKVNNDVERSIQNKFEGEKIVLYNLENKEYLDLPLLKIVKSKLNKYEKIDDITEIFGTGIKVGKYLNSNEIPELEHDSDNNTSTYCKIDKIEYDKELFCMNIHLIILSNENGDIKKIPHIINYNMIKNNTEYQIFDLYSSIDSTLSNEKFPMFHLDGNIVRLENDEKLYYLDEMFDMYRDGFIYNKIDKNIINIKHIQKFQSILMSIYNFKIVTYNMSNIPNYSYINCNKFDIRNIIDKNFIIVKNTNDVYINSEYCYIITTRSNFDNSFNNLICEYVCVPCIVDDKLYEKNVEYISHRKNSFHDKFYISKIFFSEYEYKLSFDIIDSISGKTSMISISEWTCNTMMPFDKCECDIEGIRIGQWGKLRTIGASLGFKKSKYFKVTNIYKRYKDGKIMILFNNNISVSLDLIDLEYFNKSPKNDTNKNYHIYSYTDFYHISNSKRQLHYHITTGMHSDIKCEID